MTLRPVEVHVGFRGGVETRQDPKVVPPTQLLVLENGQFRKSGAIAKRNGYESLSSAIDGSVSVLTGAIRTATRDNELIAFSASRAFSRQSGVDQWSDTGAVYSAVGNDRPLVKTGTQQLMSDHATLDGVTVAAWEDSNGGVWWSVVDETSGRVYRAATQADALATAPRCVPCGTNLHVYYALAASHRIMVMVVNPATPSAAVTPSILTDDLDGTNTVYDACQTTRTGGPTLIAWSESGSDDMRMGYVDQSGVLGNPTLGHPSAITIPMTRFATTPVAVAYFFVDGGNTDVLGLAHINATPSTIVRTFSGGNVATSAPIAQTSSGGAYNPTSPLRLALSIMSAATLSVVTEESAVAASNRFSVTVGVTLTTPALTFGTPFIIRSVGLASRAFAIGGSAFAAFVHDTTYFNTYVTLRLSDGIAVGRHAPAAAAGAPTRQHLSSAHVSGSVVKFALPFRERLESENNDKFRETGIRLFELDFDSDDSHQYAQLGRGLYLAGGCPQHYDGRQWTEQGFHFGPELIVATPAAGGSMTSSTTVLYRAWYEWTDAQGEVHRGPVSIGTLVTMGGADSQVTLTLPTLRVTQKPNVRICVARSLSADTGDTAEMFRVTSLDPTATGANGYVANTTSADTVSFLDRMSDATLRTQEPLYTNGGILSNDPSALGAVVFRGQSRLFFTDPSNGLNLRYSQPLDDGFGVEIPPDLVVSVDPFGGDITAGAFQDGRGVIWKASSIFVFQGDGPSPDGNITNGGFSTPQLITSDVGCTDPSSIVLTPNGHMFKSAKGIYLIARDGQVSYVGAPVEAYNTQTVRRATVMPDRTQIVFLTNSGLTLLYDHYHTQWSTFTNHEGNDAAVVNGQYYYLRTDGRIFRETPGVYFDDNARIRLRLETAWIHMLPQLQGFQRIWHLHLLGTWASPHQLGIQYQTDYTPGWTDSYWYDATGLSSSAGWITGGNAATIGLEPIVGTNYGDGNYGDGAYGGTAPGLYAWRLHLDEAGQSIQFRFEDFEAEGYAGASFELTEMVLTGGIKANAIKPYTASRSL